MSDNYTEHIAPGAFSRSIGKPIPVVWPGKRRIGTGVIDDDGTMTLEITDPEWAARLTATFGPPMKENA